MTALSSQERQHHFAQLRRLVNALAQAPTRHQRLGVLKLALISFDHQVTDVLDDTVAAGAPEVFCSELRKKILAGSKERDEVNKLCKLLLTTFRCSDKVAVKCFHSIAYDMVLVLFAVAANPALSATETAFRVLDRFESMALSAKSTEQSDKLLLFLLRVLRQFNTSIDMGAKEAVDHAVALVFAMSKCSESKQIITSFPGLIETIVDILGVTKPTSPYNTTMLCIQLLESVALDNRSRNLMLTKRKLLETLLGCCKSCVPEISCCSLRTLRLFSVEKSNKINLCRPQLRVLNILQEVLRDQWCKDTEAKQIALSILANLTFAGTAGRIGQLPGMIDGLADYALTGETTLIKITAAQTIKRLATFITTGDKCHGLLLEALAALATSQEQGVLMWTARALKSQSSMVGSGFVMVRDDETIEALASFAASDQSRIREPALQSIANLAQQNPRKLSGCPTILDSLVHTITHSSENSEFAVSESVRAILGLVSHGTAMTRVAKHFGLVASLSRFGMDTTSTKDPDLQKAALHGVVVLAHMI